MLLTQVLIENAAKPQDIRIENGHFTAIADHLTPQDQESVIDGHHKLLLPPFVDPHVHLDSTMTAGDPEWNQTGTLFDGIRIWSERKKTLTIEDVKTRSKQTLRRMAANGIQFVRSHVDVTDPNLTALKALIEVREEIKADMTLQLVAFPQEGILSFPHGRDLMEEAAKLGVDVIGAIPHFEFTREYSVESLHVAVELAEKYGLLVDAHCDEIDDPASRGLETLATLAYETGLKDQITASHTTAMGSYNDAYAYKLMRLLQLADINMISNPLINTHLGGRFDTYPKRRGLTRVKELTAAGVTVAFGEDDIKDPWYPMGDGNMLDVVATGLPVTQLMGYDEIMNSYRFITYNGAKALHLGEQYGIAVGRPANCILMNNDNFYNALNQHSEILYSIHNGHVIGETAPKVTTLHLNF